MTDSIRLDNIGHHFDAASERIELFNELSCIIRSGHSLAITGPSGTGKSSLLSIAAGLETPKRGTVCFTIDGLKVGASALRKNSGFIFQQFHLMPELDAIGNLALPLRLRGVRDAFDIAAHWLKKVGLHHRPRHQPHQLSGGEQQRVAIARAFIAAPKFVFADEPTGSLDFNTSDSIASLMFDCARETKCGLMIVTHSERLARRASTRLILDDGRLEVAP